MQVVFCFIYCFLCCAKAFEFKQVPFLFPLFRETDQKRCYCDSCQRIFCLCFPLGVLQCLVLHLGHILSLFFCTVLKNDLVLFSYMQLFSFSQPHLLKTLSFNIVQSYLLFHRLIDHRHMIYFWIFYPVPLIYISIFVLTILF